MLLLLQGFVTYLPYIVYYALTHSFYSRFFPMLLLLQGFVTYLPYIVYYALTHSVIFPVLNEAQDMIKITSFDITPEKEADHLFGETMFTLCVSFSILLSLNR